MTSAEFHEKHSYSGLRAQVIVLHLRLWIMFEWVCPILDVIDSKGRIKYKRRRRR